MSHVCNSRCAADHADQIGLALRMVLSMRARAPIGSELRAELATVAGMLERASSLCLAPPPVGVDRCWLARGHDGPHSNGPAGWG